MVFEAGTSDTKHNSGAEKRKFEEAIASPELGSSGRVSFEHAPIYEHSASHTPRRQRSHLTCNCVPSKARSIETPNLPVHGSGQLEGIMPQLLMPVIGREQDPNFAGLEMWHSGETPCAELD